MGKYRILDENLWGLKGMDCRVPSHLFTIGPVCGISGNKVLSGIKRAIYLLSCHLQSNQLSLLIFH